MEKTNYRIIKHNYRIIKRRFLTRMYLLTFITIVTAVIGMCMFTSKASGDLDDARYKYYTSVKISEDDNLWDISGQYMSSEYKSRNDLINEIMSLNNMSDYKIKTGECIIVPYYSSEATL